MSLYQDFRNNITQSKLCTAPACHFQLFGFLGPVMAQHQVVGLLGSANQIALYITIYTL